LFPSDSSCPPHSGHKCTLPSLLYTRNALTPAPLNSSLAHTRSMPHGHTHLPAHTPKLKREHVGGHCLTSAARNDCAPPAASRRRHPGWSGPHHDGTCLAMHSSNDQISSFLSKLIIPCTLCPACQAGAPARLCLPGTRTSPLGACLSESTSSHHVLRKHITYAPQKLRRALPTRKAPALER
jgi:hypothetical protein